MGDNDPVPTRQTTERLALHPLHDVVNATDYPIYHALLTEESVYPYIEAQRQLLLTQITVFHENVNRSSLIPREAKSDYISTYHRALGQHMQSQWESYNVAQNYSLSPRVRQLLIGDANYLYSNPYIPDVGFNPLANSPYDEFLNAYHRSPLNSLSLLNTIASIRQRTQLIIPASFIVENLEDINKLTAGETPDTLYQRWFDRRHHHLIYPNAGIFGTTPYLIAWVRGNPNPHIYETTHQTPTATDKKASQRLAQAELKGTLHDNVTGHRCQVTFAATITNTFGYPNAEKSEKPQYVEQTADHLKDGLMQLSIIDDSTDDTIAFAFETAADFQGDPPREQLRIDINGTTLLIGREFDDASNSWTPITYEINGERVEPSDTSLQDFIKSSIAREWLGPNIVNIDISELTATIFKRASTRFPSLIPARINEFFELRRFEPLTFPWYIIQPEHPLAIKPRPTKPTFKRPESNAV